MKTVLIIFVLLMGFFKGGDPPTNYTEKLENLNLSFDMVYLAPGTFKMGSESNDESPVHQVTLDGFYMASTEVTWNLFEPFLLKNFEASLSSAPIDKDIDAISRPTTPYLDMTFGMGKVDKPVVGVTQYAAKQFCRWLYEHTGHFYRLPTEAEWEYAASCGQGHSYQMNDSLDEVAWDEKNSDGTTHEVGSKSPNQWGFYDMLGNVMEWTEDAYVDHYESTSETNPVVLSNNLYPRVLRGGHFKSPAEDLTVTKRFPSKPRWKQIDPQVPKSHWWFPEAPFVGFRVVRPEKAPSPEEIELYYNQSPIDDY